MKVLSVSAHPVFELAFRPFFLIASLFAVFSVLFWGLYLAGQVQLFPEAEMSPVVWHLHEMIFGFGAACALGFLLTAAQTWTKSRSLHGKQLVVLVVVWLAARILFWRGHVEAAALLQAVWWLLSTYSLGRLLWQGRSTRNYVFVPILIALATANLTLLYQSYAGNHALALHLGRTAILLFCVLVGIVGGRIIPLFTKNAISHAAVKPSTRLDWAVLVSSVAGAFVFFLSGVTSWPLEPAILMLFSGLLHFLRLLRWDFVKSLSVPLLWSLHFSYLLLSIGLVALGASYYSSHIQFSDALHVITIGAIGSMILSVITRVSLGHTGRKLKTNIALNIAFASILSAAGLRFLFASLGQYALAWSLSAVLWGIAFLIFFIHFSPILTSPRHDESGAHSTK